MATRAKFRCNSITDFGSMKECKFTAICDGSTPENERFQKYTPSGTLTIGVDNPAVSFAVGQNYYLDFTPAPD